MWYHLMLESGLQPVMKAEKKLTVVLEISKVKDDVPTGGASE